MSFAKFFDHRLLSQLRKCTIRLINTHLIDTTRAIYKANYLSLFFCIVYFSPVPNTWASQTAIQAKLEYTFGSQNNLLKIGLFSFAASDDKVDLEFGAGIWAYPYLTRYGAKAPNWGYGYELFALVGAGNNQNLLGSSVSMYQNDAFFEQKIDNRRGGKFFGAGLGISQDQPRGSLQKFGVQRVHLITRFANKSNSTHINFANDLRISKWMGAGLDQGPTGSLHIGHARISGDKLQRLTVGFDAFTPQPDYTRPASNPKNSEAGAKRTWFTNEPWGSLFHANFFLGISEQKRDQVWSAKLGLDSPKLGAYIQNRIHDSFGLYPRYPWPIDENAKFYFELSAATGDLD